MTSLDVDCRRWKKSGEDESHYAWVLVFPSRYFTAILTALGAFDQSQKLFASGPVFSAEVGIHVAFLFWVYFK